MRYMMKQKFFAFGDDFVIKDAHDRDMYFVDGKTFSIGDQLSFQDMSGQELAFIKQKIWNWSPTYEIHRNGQLAALVKKELFTFFRCTFSVDVPGPDDLSAEGNFTDHEYVIMRGDGVVASVSKQWFSWTDTYGVDINPGEDDILILACTVVIDMACHASEKRG